uniref:Secreted protein n=1 Tax=Cacopsylla melanoneura TaxID=428564 RepID=A0A8D9E017_9HEMI
MYHHFYLISRAVFVVWLLRFCAANWASVLTTRVRSPAKGIFFYGKAKVVGILLVHKINMAVGPENTNAGVSNILTLAVYPRSRDFKWSLNFQGRYFGTQVRLSVECQNFSFLN